MKGYDRWMGRWVAVGALLAACTALAGAATGCGDSSTGASATNDRATSMTTSGNRSTPSTTTKRRQRHHAAPPKKPRRRHRHRATGLAAACPVPSRTLSGVYHPSRLDVLTPCQYAAGVVTAVRNEEDGDLHVIVRLGAAYRQLLDAANYSKQHGGLVVELTPRDGGHLPEPTAGARIAIVGAWVLDTEHGWREIHPVFVEDLDGKAYRSGPQFGGSPPGDFSSSAAEDCRTPAGKRCIGYESGSSSGGGGGGGGGSGGGNCTPGYSPCLIYHGGADYDCAGGSGNGPYYTALGVTYRISGSDPYDLDSNGDGVGCE
jgi:uncharacterized membrane protein YgcG